MLTFQEQGHIYRWNGIIVPSVTQLLSKVGARSTLKDGTERWHSISGSEFIGDDTAANFGIAFHKIAEAILNGWKVTYDPQMEPWVAGLKKFLKDHIDYIPVTFYNERMVEKMLYSKRHGYPLTLDVLLINKITEQYYLVDWKTSTTWQKHWWIQLGAYAEAVRENYKLRKKITTKIVRIFENGYETEEHKPAQVQSDFNKFLSVKNVYNLAA